MSRSNVQAAMVHVALVALCVLQSPGLLSADTKLDLVVDPLRYLATSLDAWAPDGQFGQVQNQAYGYLWPMGPFFLAGHELGISAWLIQRLWWALLLCLGFEGTRRLLSRWGVGSPGLAMVGALAYVGAPRVIGVLGTTSVEAWPAMVLPWILLPLARRDAPVRAAALSGAAALLLGGVNAAASLAVLVVPALWLLLAQGLDRRWTRLGMWLLAMLLACAWWLAPLVVLSSAAFPFLDFIESAATTTATTSLVSILRGSEHWVAWSGTDAGPAWTAGYEMATGPLLVLATALVGAVGLAGLSLRSPRVAQQRFLLCTLAVGLALIGMGYAGAFGGPWAEQVRVLLNGPLAPFRNVHKLDPLVRLPIAVGLVHALSRLAALSAEQRVGARRVGEQAAWLRPAALVSVAATLLLATSPFLAGRAASRGAFAEVPDYWRSAATWLDGNVGHGRVLVLPSSNFGEYTWGRPLDEPLTAMSQASWVLRNAIPLGAPGATRWMDAVDGLVRTGRGSDQLAETLAGAGITEVLLRNDLSADLPRTPAAAVRSALVGSPGVERVAGFGPEVEDYLGQEDGAVVAGALRPQQLEVFSVSADAPAATVASGALVVQGGPEASVTHGLASVPWIAAEDSDDPADVTTDTMLRRSQNFGAERGFDTTPVLTPEADALRGRAAADVTPFDQESPRTTLRLVGEVRSVAASSSRADPFTPGYLGPQARPFLAVDGDEATSWLPARTDEHPSLRLALAQPAAALSITLVGAGPASVQAVTVRTPEASLTAPVHEGRASVALPAPASSITIELPGGGRGRLGIAEVAGLLAPTVEEYVVPDPAAPDAVIARIDGGRRPCLDTGVGWACSEDWARTGQEQGPILRPGLAGGTGAPTVQVRAVESAALDSALDRAAGLTVSASSRVFADSAARGGAALDGDEATAWLPAASDVSPHLEFATDRPRTATSFRLGVDTAYQGLRAALIVDGRPVATGVEPGQTVTFPQVRGSSWSVRLTRAAETPTALRVAEVDLGWAAPGPVTVDCAAGLAVTVGGRSFPIRLRTTVSALVGGGDIAAQTCDATDAAASYAGVRSVDLPWLQVTGIGWLPKSPTQVAVEVTAQGSEHRAIEVPAGAAGRILVLAEGFNPGWRASTGGSGELTAVRVAGWRQAWVLPETSAPTTITAVFAPGGAHRAGLVGGAALGVLLLVGCGVVVRRRPAGPVLSGAEGGPGVPAPVVVAALLVVALLTTGPVGTAVAATAVLICLRGPAGTAPALIAVATLVAVVAVLAPALPAGLEQLAMVAALGCAARGLVGPGPQRVLDDDQRDPGHRDRQRDGGAQQEQEAATEQRDAEQARHLLEQEQVPEEDPVAD